MLNCNNIFYTKVHYDVINGAMAHLGARQTEDLEVAGSSPACPIVFFLKFLYRHFIFLVWLLQIKRDLSKGDFVRH